ncbi:MAG: DinB family protein [Acidobacteriota bacterium]
MTPEQSVVATVVHAWKQNLERADRIFSTLSERDLQREVGPGKNRLVYLWGHLIAVHDAMLPLLGLGERLHPELDDAFLKNPDRVVADSLSAADLKRLWNEVNQRLLEAFGAFTAAEWTEKHTVVSAEDFAVNPLRNRLSILLSRTSHVSYHLGQATLAPR